MALVVTETGGNFSTATWYRVEAYSLNSSGLATTLASNRYITVTYANAGNLRGVVTNGGLITLNDVPVDRAAVLRLQKANTATLPTASPGIVTQTGHGFTGGRSGVTISYANPCVVTYASHGLREGDIVQFGTSGSLPTGLTTTSTYYVRYIDVNTFNLSASAKGALIETTSSGSGTHTMYVEFVEFTTTGALPTGVTANTQYMVEYIDANRYYLKSYPSGSRINFTGSPSGTHTAWVNKDVSVKTTADFFGTGQSKAMSSVFFVPFLFSGTVAVDTTANGWRYKYFQSGGSGNNIATYGDSSNQPYHISWCDTTVSFSDGNDAPIICSPTTINTNTSWKGTIRWYSSYAAATTALAGLICAPTSGNRAYSSSGAGNAMLKWDGTASHTLTIDGVVCVSTHAGIYIGTEDSPISYANKAILNMTPPTFSGSSANYTGFMDNSVGSNYYGGGQTIVLSGSYPTQRYATLVSDAAAGQKDLVVDDASGFANNDYVYISKEDAAYSTSLNATRYQISSIAGTTITLTANITGTRLTGGRVVLCERGYGVQVYCTSLSTYVLPFRFAPPANIYFKGAYFRGGVNIAGYSTGYRFIDNLTNLRSGGWYIGYSLTENYQNAQSASCNLTATPYCNQIGGTIENNLCVAGYICGSISTSTITQGIGLTSKTGQLTLKNNFTMRSSSHLFYAAGSGMPSAVFEDNIGHNVAYASYGQNNTYRRNYIYGSSTPFYMYPAYFMTMEDNIGERCVTGWLPNVTAINLIKVRDYRSTVTGATGYNIAFTADTYADYDFISPAYDLTNRDETYINDIVQGSEFRVTNNNSTTNYDLVITANGYLRRCGDGLTDTTVHTVGSGKYSIRFESTSSANRLEFESSRPTGNIQNKDLVVGVWCKINSATYYAGIHQLPRLTVNYDDGTLAYCQAAESTDWQFLLVPVTPTSTFGQIRITLSTMTDATTTNAYVYFDDLSVLDPAGVVVSTGGMDLWADAKPITPFISTSISANDVWAANPTTIGDGTMGDILLKAQKAADDAATLSML